MIGLLPTPFFPRLTPRIAHAAQVSHADQASPVAQVLFGRPCGPAARAVLHMLRSFGAIL